MRSLGWTQIQYDWYPLKKKKKFGHRQTQRQDDMKGHTKKVAFTSQRRDNLLSVLRRNQPCPHLDLTLARRPVTTDACGLTCAVGGTCLQRPGRCNPSQRVRQAVRKGGASGPKGGGAPASLSSQLQRPPRGRRESGPEHPPVSPGPVEVNVTTKRLEPRCPTPPRRQLGPP